MDLTNIDVERPVLDSRDPWTKYKDDPQPNIFANLKLAHDGGFGEVGQLFTSSRWSSAVLMVVFVIYNVEYIITLDYGFIRDPNNVEGYTAAEIKKINSDFYLTRSFYRPVLDLINRVHGSIVLDPEHIVPTQVLGLLEFVGLMYYLLVGVLNFLGMAIFTGKRRWFAVQTFFWDLLPVLSVYSALKLLDKIVPAVLTANLTMELALASDRLEQGKSRFAAFGPVLGFIVKVIVCFVVGFDQFLLKLRVVNTDAGKLSLSVSAFSHIILLLVQVLGVVQLGPFVRLRLFAFIFAGEDGIMQEREKELMLTWNALLARRIYTEYSCLKFLVVMLSFTDEDFQKLVLNETSISEQQEISLVPELAPRVVPVTHNKVNAQNKDANSSDCFHGLVCTGARDKREG
jgi:hypothetical protein